MPDRIGSPSAHIKTYAKGLSVPLSLILPIVTLYILDPKSFEGSWKGRFPYLFFLWLFFLEFALARRKLPTKLSLKKTPFSLQRKIIRAIIPKRLKLLARSKRMSFLLQHKKIHAAVMAAERFFVAVLRMAPILVAVVAMAVPTAYVIGTYMFGLKRGVIEVGSLLGLPTFGYPGWFLTVHWPLSVEYLVFTAFFTASVLLTYGIKGLKRFSVSLFFLGAIGSFFMIDTFYPSGTLIALQKLVPFSASSAANVLNWMGYETRLLHYGFTRYLDTTAIKEVVTIIWVGRGAPKLLFAINWPCAGVHSLFIYTFVILLFLKDTHFSLQRKVIQSAIPERLKLVAKGKRISFLLGRKKIRFSVMAAERLIVEVLRMVPIFIVIVAGAVGTFIVNVLRIASICIVGVNAGQEAAQMFHNYYGELYFIVWILLYLLTIIYGPTIWARPFLGMRARAKGLMRSPTDAFNSVKDEDWHSSMVHFTRLLVFSTILLTVILAVIFLAIPLTIQAMIHIPIFPIITFLGPMVITIPIGTVIGWLISLLIGSLWMHIWVYVVGGRKGLGQTIKSMAYGSTPSLLLGWMPLLGIVFIMPSVLLGEVSWLAIVLGCILLLAIELAFWSLVLLIIGIRQLHEISTRRAVAAVLGAVTPPLIILIILVAMGALVVILY